MGRTGTQIITQFLFRARHHFYNGLSFLNVTYFYISTMRTRCVCIVWSVTLYGSTAAASTQHILGALCHRHYTITSGARTKRRQKNRIQQPIRTVENGRGRERERVDLYFRHMWKWRSVICDEWRNKRDNEELKAKPAQKGKRDFSN